MVNLWHDGLPGSHTHTHTHTHTITDWWQEEEETVAETKRRMNREKGGDSVWQRKRDNKRKCSKKKKRRRRRRWARRSKFPKFPRRGGKQLLEQVTQQHPLPENLDTFLAAKGHCSLIVNVYYGGWQWRQPPSTWTIQNIISDASRARCASQLDPDTMWIISITSLYIIITIITIKQVLLGPTGFLNVSEGEWQHWFVLTKWA